MSDQQVLPHSPQDTRSPSPPLPPQNQADSPNDSKNTQQVDLNAEPKEGGSKDKGDYDDRRRRHRRSRDSSRERRHRRKRSRSKSPISGDSAIVYVQGLKPDVNDQDLEKLFAKYGTIKSIKIVLDRNKVSRGFAFITMSSQDDLKKVMVDVSANPNAFEIRGNSIQVEEAKSKKPRPETPGRYLGNRPRGGYYPPRHSHYPPPHHPPAYSYGYPPYDPYPPPYYPQGGSAPPPAPRGSGGRYSPPPGYSRHSGSYPSEYPSYPGSQSNYPSSYSKKHDPYLHDEYNNSSSSSSRSHHHYSSRRRSKSPYSRRSRRSNSKS